MVYYIKNNKDLLMKKINNLIYILEIKYKNKSGLHTSISIKLHDSGLKIKSVRVGNTCITEETINGRILSGKFENPDGYCGYRYDYQNGENIQNINANISIDKATSLISTKKMKPDFISAELVLSSIVRNDYSVVILDKGCLYITKTISAENEKLEKCCLQENIELIKLEGEKSFVEKNKKSVYKIDDKCVIEENNNLDSNDIKLQLNELSDIISLNPQNYKELIQFKNQIQTINSNDTSNEGKFYE